MNGEVRTKLVDAIVRTYTIDQLKAIVRQALGRDLEYYVGISDRLTTVDTLIAELERRPDDCERMLVKLRVWTLRPELRAAIDNYYGAPPSPDPFEEVVVLGEPFVDRQVLRTKLRDLFQIPNRRAMVVRGPEATGKSYSRWIIEHVCRSQAIDPVFVQLKGTLFDDILAQLINDLNLPPRDYRDRMAQFSTMSKGFISALRGYVRQMPAGQHWCLIFDSHDHDTVSAEARGFVDELLQEVASLQMLPIWMVVLGYHAASAVTVAGQRLGNIIIDDIVHVTQPDVDTFLFRIAESAGRLLVQEELEESSAAIFDGIIQPFDHEKMNTLTGRLRDKVAEFGAMR